MSRIYLATMWPVDSFAILVVDCVASLIRLKVLLKVRVLRIVHFLVCTRFLHGNSALDHGLVFSVLKRFQFVLTQISGRVQVRRTGR